MDIEKVAKLANLPLTPDQLQKQEASFSQVLDLVNHIRQLDTSNVLATSQVTGLENITRDDVIDSQRVFSQKEALSNAKQVHNGYFVVPAIIHE